MHQPSPGSRDLSDILQDFLTVSAKALLWLGLALFAVSLGLLVFTLFRVGQPNAQSLVADAIKNVSILQILLVAGSLGVSIGSAYLFWGESVMDALLLMCGAALYFSPLFLPMIFGSSTNDATTAAYGALQSGGLATAVVGLLATIGDVATRVRDRSKHGVKADTLKYGKGIQIDNERQDVFMGKCWQLPFCRKFVRERCPIYHAKTCCWKERVGCMCEEQVIRGAMENRAIPKDALLAAKYIPRNNRLTESQKAERCRNCVIYNHHQMQKYKAAVPAVICFLLLLVVALHAPLNDLMAGLVSKVNAIVHIATYTNGAIVAPPIYLSYGMLAVFTIVVLSYCLKLIEFLIFKLKV